MSADPPVPALRAQDVRAGYGAGDIIHGVSVSVAPGTVASVVGPNGSGKSTLLKALTGVIRPSSGRVFAGARDITGLPPEEVARAGVGYVPQTDDVFGPLTVRENLEMGGYLLGSREVGARIERVTGVFPRLGQMMGRRAGRLSGGERKMLAMGRVLMVEPAVFLLDEPTANLAPQIAAELLTGHVRALAEAGAAVLIVEQRARAVLAISDYTYVLGGGQVLMADTPARLSASQEFTESFFGTAPQLPKSLAGPAAAAVPVRACPCLRGMLVLRAISGMAKPVGLLFVACLHNITDSDDPTGIVVRYLEALAPGSYLVISHVTDEFAPERMHAITAEYAKRGTTFVGRSKEAITRMFNGAELVDPGVVLLSYWRPDEGQPDYSADQVWGYCGVARV